MDKSQKIKQLLDKRKDIVKSTQFSGSGKVENNNLPADIEAIAKSGDRDAIKANLDQVRKAYGIKS